MMFIVMIRVFGMHRRTTRARLKDQSSSSSSEANVFRTITYSLPLRNEHEQRVLSENNDGERSSTGSRRASRILLLFSCVPRALR